MTSLLLGLLAAQTQTYTNPVYNRDLPDPCVIRDGRAFWMTHTTGGPDVGWPLYMSSQGQKWRFVTHLLDRKNKAPWMKDSFWAPEIFRAGPERYLLTFTATNRTTGRLCIGMATSKHIEGPYTVLKQPLISDTVSVLDSHIFRDEAGRLILYWKRDGNNFGINGSIRARLLDSTGTRFNPAAGDFVALQGNEANTAPESAWERGLVEAPWVMKRGEFYYLFYSGAFIDTSYALGVARSSSPLGPFTRNPANPILKSNATWGGPGHGAFFQDDAGADFHYYHARSQANPNFGRVQMMDRVIWNGDWPTFPNGGTPTTTPQVAPVIGRTSPYAANPLATILSRASSTQ